MYYPKTCAVKVSKYKKDDSFNKNPTLNRLQKRFIKRHILCVTYQ